MILAIGLVVDDAIIVVERVEYLMDKEGLEAKEAAVKAMKQIGSAIIATTFVLLSIFVPVGLMAGITGKIYQQFAVTIATSVVFSAINALTLSPSLCAIFLRGDKHQEAKGFFKTFDNLIEKGQQKYLKTVRFFASKLKTTTFVTIITIILIAFGFKLTPTSFLPEEDQGIVFANIQLSNTATINQTNDVLADIAQDVLKMDGVKYFISVAGYSILGGGGENVALGVVGLENWDKRKSKKLSAENITAKLMREYGQNSKAQIDFFAPPSIPGIGNSNGLSIELLALDGNTTGKQLFDEMERLLYTLNKNKNLAYAFSTYTADTPHIYLDIARTKLETYKVPVSLLFTTLNNNLGSSYINNITLDGQVNKVIAQADYQYRRSIDSVMNLYVKSDNGSMVRVKSFANNRVEISPKILYRYNTYTAAAVTAQSATNISSGTAIDTVIDIANIVLP